jgi:hypothetical protein
VGNNPIDTQKNVHRIRNAELLLVLASQFDKELKQCRPENPFQTARRALPNRCRRIGDRLNPPTLCDLATKSRLR